MNGDLFKQGRLFTRQCNFNFVNKNSILINVNYISGMVPI